MTGGGAGAIENAAKAHDLKEQYELLRDSYTRMKQAYSLYSAGANSAVAATNVDQVTETDLVRLSLELASLFAMLTEKTGIASSALSTAAAYTYPLCNQIK